MSLRTRLLAGMLVLISVALVVAAAAIYEEQRSFLDNRLDQRVVAAAAPISYELGVDARLLKRPTTDHDTKPAAAKEDLSPLGKGLAGFLPTGTYGELIGARGRLLRGPVTTSYGEAQLSAPRFPARFPITHPSSTPKLFTVPSEGNPDLRYRVAALALQSRAGAVIVAVPLREVDDTLHGLFIAELVVVPAIILVLVGLGWIVIRVGLRPLDHMGRVASAIADGDLSRRVSPADNRTEVGRLGLSLNKMLVRIEEAFDDRANSEERRRQFLSDASHELRTPLASIRGYAELFRLGPAQSPAELERAMARIEAEAARMGVLVEDLLALARFDELPEAQRTRVDVSELGAHAIDDARATAPGRTLTFSAPGPLEVLASPDALRQLLANLIGNALIHTPDDSPVELIVSTDGGEVTIEVRDHGPGIPPGAEEQVFERFWRAEGGRTRGRGGSGLGLSIVREIVAAHGGTVAASNHPDGGARLIVRLPAAPAVPAPVPAAPRDERAPAHART